MAYAASGLNLLIPRITGGPAVFHYSSADAHGTVEGAGYFSDGGDRGMKVGDTVIVVDNDAVATTIHTVTTVTAGAATINAATLA